MNSIKVSKLFPSGTVIVAYMGKILGGAKVMPKWEIEPIIDESQYLRSNDNISANLKVENLITIEFNTVDPQHSASKHEFSNTSGELTFVPLDRIKKYSILFLWLHLKISLKQKRKVAFTGNLKFFTMLMVYSCKK